MTGIAEFVLAATTSLIANAVSSFAEFKALPYLQKKKIESRVEIATIEVTEPLIPFLESENISKERQKLLIDTCKSELLPLSNSPEKLFANSLDGQKIYDDLYKDKGLPQAIIDEDLSTTYGLFFPRIATVLCSIPAAVKDWELNAWKENYRKLDEMAVSVRALLEKLDSTLGKEEKVKGNLFSDVRKSLAQKSHMKLDLTGLRADKPIKGKMEDFFVHPELVHKDRNGINYASVDKPSQVIRQFIFDSRSTILYGDAGAGKSTWTQWLEREALTKNWSGIAIRIELRKIALNDDLPSLHLLIKNNLSVHLQEDTTHDKIREWIESNSVFFILDGFDEISEEQRNRVAEWIKELRIILRECPILVTSRPLTTDQLNNFDEQWKRWYINPFDSVRITQYIKLWYDHTPLLLDGVQTVDTEDLAHQLLNDSVIGPLTSNPLLLSTLLMVHHLDGSLPNGRSQLYERYVEGMLGIWDNRREVTAQSIPLLPKEKMQILAWLALHCHLKKIDQIDEKEVLQVISECLDHMDKKISANEVLAALLERSGLIIGPGTYSFIHKTVAEFLVATIIVQGCDCDKDGKRVDRMRLFEHRADDRWNVITFLWAGLAPLADVVDFIKHCFKVNDIDLGIGLFHDQYDRFTKKTKQNIVIDLKGIDINLIRSGSYYVFSGHKDKKDDRRIPIPTLSLRTVSDHTDIVTVIRSLINDDFLTHSDLSSITSEDLRETVWLALTHPTEGALDWATHLKMTPTHLKDNIVVRRWLSSISIRKDRYAEINEEQGRYLEILRKELHIDDEIILVSLLDGIYQCTRHHPKHRHDPSYVNEYRAEYIRVFSRTNFEIKSSPALAQTKEWVAPFDRNGDDPYDLLSMSKTTILDLEKQGEIDNELSKNAQKKIERIIKARG